jgi:hypothetical protein
VECLECHFGIEHIAARAFGRDFPHGAHVVRARLRCAACHGGMDQHGTLHIDASACDRCHARIQQPMAAVAGEDCLGCHEADIGPASEVVRFPHAQHVEAGLDCAVCHAGVERKKHVDFARSREARPPMGHELCGSCHAGDVPDAEGTPPEGANCSLCHVDF